MDTSDRVDIVHNNLLDALQKGTPLTCAPRETKFTKQEACRLFRIACLTRAFDRKARLMQKAGQGFYTIGASGHEMMAAVAAAVRVDDMAFLHYRDAAFQLMRAELAGETGYVRDMALSFAASREDPISGGRHKVLGSKSLNIPPQTSTIASHLPKSVGSAHAIGLAGKMKLPGRVLHEDSIVIASFGDASANHSSAQGALNAAEWSAFQNIAMPLLFVCEDNGIGISTKTPKGWIASAFSHRPQLKYFYADGLDFIDCFRVASEAALYVRDTRKPAFLHLEMVRLYGHAGPDMASGYLSQAEIRAQEARDPLLYCARTLQMTFGIDAGVALKIYGDATLEVFDACDWAITRPRLAQAQDVAASLVPPPRPADRQTLQYRGQTAPQPLAKNINQALNEALSHYPEVVLAGEDIGRKGGVYGVTQKLQSAFGAHRVIDTLLDEQTILGLSIGLAHNGMIPVPEIQFLAYLHNAEDQLRGEAATLSFFSNGQYTNPMVVRIAGLGYQRGFGGHFHNDNSLAVLRDIPGLIVACPSRGRDAALILRECIRLSREEARVCVFIEPIALYSTRDLHSEKDGLWLDPYPQPEETIGFGEVGVTGQMGDVDLVILTYGNGHFLSQQAAPEIKKAGNTLRIVDIRWLSPLPETAILETLMGANSILIVDECRRSGSISEALMTLCVENGHYNIARLTAEDCFIATGPAYAATLPSKAAIIEAAFSLLHKNLASKTSG